MKNKYLSRFLRTLAASVLGTALCTAPLLAADSPLAQYMDEDALNPAYTEWVKNGYVGQEPSAQDFSYLADSYAAEEDGIVSFTNGASYLPQSYDARQKGVVPSVVDQGSLGICWALSAVDSASAGLMAQFPHTRLSAIHTAWFTYTGKEEQEFSPLMQSLLSGGNDGRAVGTLAAWKGPVSDSVAPFSVGLSSNLDESLRYSAEYHLQDAYYMPSGVYFNPSQQSSTSIDTVKDIIINKGPVTLSYYAHGTGCYNAKTASWYNSHSRATDHTVLIVGWDDNYSRKNFLEDNRPSSDGAWLVRNSWGTNWGDDGYFWLSYEDQTAIIGNAYVLEEATNYTHNYQYDTTGWSYSMMTDPENARTATAANIFTALDNEQLEAVSYYTTDANTQVNVSIYTDVDEASPESGTLVLKNQTTTEAYAGYHTLELDKAVRLTKGKNFSIVITFKNPTYHMPLAIEWCPNASQIPQYMGNGGESYIKTIDGWKDVAGTVSNSFYVTNVCIKGFTNPLPSANTAVSSVRFSLMEGPIAQGSRLSLEAADDEEIYVSVDGGAYALYEGAITLDNLSQDVTVRAYAQKNGTRGRIIEKTYSKAECAASDLALRYNGTTIHLDTTEDLNQAITLPLDATSIEVMVQSSDTITLNGTALTSGTYSSTIALENEGATALDLALTASGKTSTTIHLQIERGKVPSKGNPEVRPLHAITLEGTPQNGELVLNKAKAAAGDEVLLTVKPSEGYVLESLTITTALGNHADYKALGNGVFALTMPEQDVTIKISFGVKDPDKLGFVDVPSTAWYYDSVSYIVKKGLMVGTSSDTFEPSGAVTRAMIWAVLARMDGADTTTDGLWYEGAQKWAVESGVSDGLNPTNPVTREELVTMLYRYSGQPKVLTQENGYQDFGTVSDWAKEAMRWGVENGILTGVDDNRLAPREGATRAQLATLLMRAEGHLVQK